MVFSIGKVPDGVHLKEGFVVSNPKQNIARDVESFDTRLTLELAQDLGKREHVIVRCALAKSKATVSY